MTCLLALALSVASARPPSFGLDDLGVVVNLPDGPWRVVRWSGAALTVDRAHPGGSIRLSAWGTPLQVPLGEGQDWSAVFTERLDVTPAGRSRLERVDERLVAYTDLASADGAQVVRAATLAVPGANLHVVAFGSSSPGGDPAALDPILHHVVAALEGPQPEPGAFGATLEVPGLRLVLPPAWRPLLPAEARDDLDADCEHAVFVRPAARPDRLALCPLTLGVGIVDEYTLHRVEPEVRAVAVDAGSGRGALLPRPEAPRRQARAIPERAPCEARAVPEGNGLVFEGGGGIVGVLPHAAGATKLALRGPGVDEATLGAMLAGVAQDGPHPASLSDRARYWLWDRPGPVLAVLTGLALALTGILGLRRATS